MVYQLSDLLKDLKRTDALVIQLMVSYSKDFVSIVETQENYTSGRDIKRLIRAVIIRLSYNISEGNRFFSLLSLYLP